MRRLVLLQRNCTVKSKHNNNLLFLLFSVAPGPPRQVFTDTTCKDVTLKWEQPEFNGGMEITNYVIRLLAEDDTPLHQQSVHGNLREVKIDYSEFEAEKPYKVYLMARSAAGFGKEEMVVATTKKYCE